MKKLIVLLLVGVFCFSLTACEEDSVQSVLEDTEAATAAESTAEESFEEEPFEIPDAIVNISPEDDKALTGVLTADSYTNEYFGIRFNKFEGGTIESVMDEGTDLMPLSETYANEIGIIMINSSGADNENSYHVSVYAVSSKDLGKDENTLAQEKYDFEQAANESFEFEAECSIEQITIAGEEHPAYVEIWDSDGTTKKSANIRILKGDFECNISISVDAEKFDDVLKLYEKI